MLDKPTVRVIVNVTGLPNTYKVDHSDGSVSYNGLFYDLYTKMKKNLSTKYKFVETYDEDFNVTQALDGIRDGKYDLGIQHYPIPFRDIVPTVENFDLLPQRERTSNPNLYLGCLSLTFYHND